MSGDLSYETKIEFLERQIKIINSIDFQPGYLDRLAVFESQTKKIFTTIFSDPNEYIKKIEDIRYTSSDNFDDEPLHFVLNEDYFYSGKNKTQILLISALEDVKFEKELVEKTYSTQSLQKKTSTSIDKTRVFIVHGHDNDLKNEVARFIEKLKLKAVILHEQSDRGQTIISKFEANSNVGFAIVLYTPCDVGRPTKLNTQGERYPERTRARQNVVFEHGFFAAKLGFENVVALKKGDVELPNDLSGIIYKEYDESGAWKYKIANELEESGYEIDYKSIR